MMHEGHEHCCGEHEHTHTHEDGTTHCHHAHSHDGHDHEHGHHHHHHHHEEPIQVAEKYQKIATLVNYMANHNADHTEELVHMVEQLREAGLADAADKLQDGVADFQKGNEKLKETLAIIQKAAE